MPGEGPQKQSWNMGSGGGSLFQVLPEETYKEGRKQSKDEVSGQILDYIWCKGACPSGLCISHQLCWPLLRVEV